MNYFIIKCDDKGNYNKEAELNAEFNFEIDPDRFNVLRRCKIA